MLWVLEPALFSQLDVSPDVPVLASSMDLATKRWLVGINEMFLEENLKLTGVRIDVRIWEDISFAFLKAADSKVEPLVQSLEWAGEIGVLVGFAYDGAELKIHGFLRDSKYYCEVRFQQPELYVEYLACHEFIPHTLP